MKKCLLQIALFAAAGCFMLGSSGPICSKDPPSGTRPEVTYMYPNDGDTNVRLDQNVIVNFSKAMSSSFTESAFQIVPPATGTFVWHDDHKSLTFKPDPDLQPNTTYSVTIATTARSQEGWEMESSRKAAWTTGS